MGLGVFLLERLFKLVWLLFLLPLLHRCVLEVCHLVDVLRFLRNLSLVFVKLFRMTLAFPFQFLALQEANSP